MGNSTILSMISVAAGAVLLLGCAAREQIYPANEPLCPDKATRLDVMQAAEATLRAMHFVIDKLDVEHGVIRTRPLRGAQFFELWRSDNVDSFNTAEANLQTIRRSVELRINDDDGALCMDCTVPVQRLSLPENEVASTAQAYQMYSQSTRFLQRLELNPEQRKGMAWIDMGRDNRLEAKILKRIARKVKRPQEKESP